MKNAKKAIVGLIMIGFLLIFSSVIFIGTVSDKVAVTNKVAKIRKTLQTASLSAAKYYIDVNTSTSDAEKISRNLICQTKLGAEINSSLGFDWNLTAEPNYLIVTLPSYKQDLFWFKFLGWNDKNITNMSSKANIVNVNPTDGFAPIAINGCDKTFDTGDEISLLLGEYDYYTDTRFKHFFPLWTGESDGNSQFVDWAKDGMGEIEDGSYTLSDDMITDFYSLAEGNIEATDVKKLALSMGMDDFSPIVASVTILDCDSNKTNPIVKESKKVLINSIECSPD